MNTKLLALALVLVFGLVLGWKLGADHERAKQLEAANAAIKLQDKGAASSAAAGNAAAAAGDARQIDAKVETEKGNETIRTVYRTIRVAADCVQPAPVVQQLEASRGAANGAVQAASGGAGAGTAERSRLPWR